MHVSAALLVAGLLPWIWHLHTRAADPGTFAAGALPMWPLALTSGVLPPWVGVVIGSMAVVFALTLITRDMVPAVY